MHKIALSDAALKRMTARTGKLHPFDEIDPRKARVVELRFFGGLEVRETAEVLGVSPETVMRDWRMARSWLLGELSHYGLVS